MRPFYLVSSSTICFSMLLCGAAVGQVVLQSIPLGAYDLVTLCGDIDGDGVRDIALERVAGSAPRVLDFFSMRSGQLLYHVVPPSSQSYGTAAYVGDLNGDGRADLAYMEFHPNSPAFFYHAFRSGLDGSYLHFLPWQGGVMGLGDVNGNGSDDFLLVDEMADVGTLMNAGHSDLYDGLTGAVLRSHSGSSSMQRLGVLGVVGDLDRDGVRDYVMADTSRLYGVSAASGTVLFTLPRWSSTYGEWMADAGDLDGDGFDDIVFRDRGGWPHTAYESIHVFAGPDAVRQLWSHTTWLMNRGPVYYHSHVGKIGDMDGDGHDDLGLGGGGPGVGSTILSGRDFSVIWEQTTVTSLVPAILSYGLTGPGDVDGDGVPDVLMRGAWTPQTPFVALVSFAMPGVMPLGSPCPGALGLPPRIGIGVGARLGQTMTVNLSNANSNLHFAMLGAGFSNQQWQGTVLPLDLGGFGLPGCFWRVAADVSLLVPTSGGAGTLHRATYAVPIPAHPAQLGTQVFWQWLVVEPGPLGLTASTTMAMRSVVVQ